MCNVFKVAITLLNAQVRTLFSKCLFRNVYDFVWYFLFECIEVYRASTVYSTFQITPQKKKKLRAVRSGERGDHGTQPERENIGCGNKRRSADEQKIIVKQKNDNVLQIPN